MELSSGPLSPLQDFNQRLVHCERCPRLSSYCAEIARTKRRAYIDAEYWGRPVPSFGDEQARVLLLGLAPGAHGSNRTGRPFTGDGSGDFLFPTLYETGFGSQPTATGKDDGLKLSGLWINSVGRCAPPGNKPTTEELRTCSAWLDEELALLTDLRVIVCLGKIAFDGALAHLLRTGRISRKTGLVFGHAAEYRIDDRLTLMASYHPSLQNTNTGKLTRPMFLSIFMRARELAALTP